MSLLAADPAVIESYRKDLVKFGPDARALGWTKKGKPRLRYGALLGPIPRHGTTVFDWGCGLGDLRSWMKCQRPNLGYAGADPVREFVNIANERYYPTDTFWHMTDPSEIEGNWDHIVCCGILTRVGGRTPQQHLDHVAATLKALFERCRVGLHFDFLTNDSTKIEPGNFYADPIGMIEFAVDSLSKRSALDLSYLPYEGALHVWKSTTIDPVKVMYQEHQR